MATKPTRGTAHPGSFSGRVHKRGGEGTAPMETVLIQLPRIRMDKLKQRAQEADVDPETLASEIVDVWLAG